MNAPRLNPSQIGWCTIYLPQRNGKLSWRRWLVTHRDGLPAHRQSHIEVLTRRRVTSLLDETRYRYTTPQKKIPRTLFWGRAATTAVLLSSATTPSVKLETEGSAVLE